MYLPTTRIRTCSKQPCLANLPAMSPFPSACSVARACALIIASACRTRPMPQKDCCYSKAAVSAPPPPDPQPFERLGCKRRAELPRSMSANVAIACPEEANTGVVTVRLPSLPLVLASFPPCRASHFGGTPSFFPTLQETRSPETPSSWWEAPGVVGRACGRPRGSAEVCYW